MRKPLQASALLALGLASSAAGQASAASSGWHEEEGASIRLVTAEPADRSGVLRGALEIVLKPGWKTYWRDPGTAGVPPSIDFTGSSNVSRGEADFPVPERHDDGYGPWAGYSVPVTLPVRVEVPDPSKPSHIEAAVFLGLCRDICVPVSLRLSLATGEGADAEETAAVDRAFAALPAPATDSFGITGVASGTNALVIDAKVPEGVEGKMDLFLAGDGSAAFGLPAAERIGGGQRFTVPLLGRAARGMPVRYTLVVGARAVSGMFDLP